MKMKNKTTTKIEKPEFEEINKPENIKIKKEIIKSLKITYANLEFEDATHTQRGYVFMETESRLKKLISPSKDIFRVNFDDDETTDTIITYYGSSYYKSLKESIKLMQERFKNKVKLIIEKNGI